MMMAEEKGRKDGKRRWWQRISFKKLNRKYVFLMSHEETMEPIVDFRVNLMNIIIIAIASIVFLIAITTLIIAFTPLREYIPGYTDTSLKRELYALNRRADSIEEDLHRKDVYFNNLKLIIEGYEFDNDSLHPADIYTPMASFDIDTIALRRSAQDSALRAEFERDNMYNLPETDAFIKTTLHPEAAKFFTPITGRVILPYDPTHGHYGIDIASTENQVIKATLDGTVIYSSWTLDFGYTIGIQHNNNYFSTYKHNATLLKKEGDYVKAGEAIAIVGESGEQVTEQHLHFELWHNGVSVNPQEYINFEKGEGE